MNIIAICVRDEVWSVGSLNRTPKCRLGLGWVAVRSVATKPGAV